VAAQSQLRLLRTALRTDRARGEPVMELWPLPGVCWTMRDFPIDPELRICVSAPGVLRRTNEAIAFIRKMIRSRSERAWLDVQQSFETPGTTGVRWKLLSDWNCCSRPKAC